MAKSTKKPVQWEVLVAVGAFIVTMIGVVLPLFIHLDSKSLNQITAIREDINAMREDVKEFHGRLCAIEERRNK